MHLPDEPWGTADISTTPDTETPAVVDDDIITPNITVYDTALVQPSERGVDIRYDASSLLVVCKGAGNKWYPHRGNAKLTEVVRYVNEARYRQGCWFAKLPRRAISGPADTARLPATTWPGGMEGRTGLRPIAACGLAAFPLVPTPARIPG